MDKLMREEFEQWCKTVAITLDMRRTDFLGEPYALRETAIAWQAWQGAIQSQHKHLGAAPDDAFHPTDAGHEKIAYHHAISELKDKIRRFENWASHKEWCHVTMGDSEPCDCGLAELIQPERS